MNIALTGISGFIGSVIARQLHEAGHHVTGLVRATSRRDHIEPFVNRFVVGDHADDTCWPELLRDCECVIHNSLDAPRFRIDDIDGHLRSNLLGSIHLLHASAPRQFVFFSTMAVHHDMRPRWNGLIDEDHPTRPGHIYGAYKAAVEAHLWAAHYETGQHTCALRPCAVYGIDPDLKRSHGFAIIEQLRATKSYNRPGGGKFVHVDDVARATVATVGNPAAVGRPYNLADCYLRWADWAAMAAEIMGIKADIDLSSPPQARNTFTKDAAQSLGVNLDRGREGVREHLKELIRAMS
jgi:nucleoside-diphosphate-sugar epimerase